MTSTLAHLSDLHVGADWGSRDALRALASAVDAIAALEPRPQAILVSGDLAEHADPAEYAAARTALERPGLPVHVLPGNHDDRAALRLAFGLPAATGELHYAVEIGDLRLVALDTTIPGEDGGRLGREQLDWLDDALASEPARPTLLAMHHPPFTTGVPAFDALGLRAEDRDALGAVVARHECVARLVAGHVHRAITTSVAGRAALTVPSVYTALRLDLLSGELGTAEDEPPAFAVHALAGGGVVSHVVTVGAPRV